MPFDVARILNNPLFNSGTLIKCILLKENVKNAIMKIINLRQYSMCYSEDITQIKSFQGSF